jgi:hypothetical protein
MRVIRPAKTIPKPVQTMRGECKNCGCRFECGDNEAHHTETAAGSDFTIRCPTPHCGMLVRVLHACLIQW